LYACSQVYVTSTAHPDPYTVGYVDLIDGLRIFGQLLDDGGPWAPGEAVTVEVAAVRSELPQALDRPRFRFRRLENAA